MFYSYVNPTDLAGDVCFHPSLLQTKTRIKNLVATYLTDDILCDRLEDLPEQFLNPQSRPWQTINWHAIDSEQILGIEPEVFLSIIKGALDTEAPIRGYTQTSRQYLESIHPAMARFVGGSIDQNNSLVELGLWEKEERQHTPALIKIYQQLTGIKIASNAPTPKLYQPTNNPEKDLYRHGVHRIATEFSAVCLYLWLMSHTTGSLQLVLEELLIDEINHMTKFWGFGQWLYGNRLVQSLQPKPVKNILTESNRLQASSHLLKTVSRMMSVLAWESWNLAHKVELVYTFVTVGQQMWSWSNSLTREYLAILFTSSLVSEISICPESRTTNY